MRRAMPAHDLPTDNSGLNLRSGRTSVKDRDHWVLESEPMTAAQASSCLKALSQQAREREAFTPKLTRAEASRRIDALQAKLRLQDGPPHTL
jgi:hypothetical protein